MALLKIERGKITLFCGPFGCRQKINRKMQKLFWTEETMDDVNGIGLAAPQISLNIRVVICKFNHGTPHQLIVPMINHKLRIVQAMSLNEGLFKPAKTV